jgi:hypothetical protein
MLVKPKIRDPLKLRRKRDEQKFIVRVQVGMAPFRNKIPPFPDGPVHSGMNRSRLEIPYFRVILVWFGLCVNGRVHPRMAEASTMNP